MLTEADFRDTYLQVLYQNIPNPSQGQIDATLELADFVELLNDGSPIDIVLVEGIGGSGKSELISALRTQLELDGVALVPDEDKLEDYRIENGIKGIQVATGRVFGDHYQEAFEIKVNGFTRDEIAKVLVSQGLDERLANLIGEYAIGSWRIANIMRDHLVGGEADMRNEIELKNLLARIAAISVIDRVPNKYFKEQGVERVFKSVTNYVKGINVDTVQDLIYETIFSLGKKYNLLQKAFLRLGCAIEDITDRYNPVKIIADATNDKGYLVYDTDTLPKDFLKGAHEVAKLFVDESSRVVFPLDQSDHVLENLKLVLAGDPNNIRGVYHEPRVDIVASVPISGHLRNVLRNCFEQLIDFNRLLGKRKTALAIFNRETDTYNRRSTYHIDGDIQFFQRDLGTGRESHGFFRPKYLALEGQLDDSSDTNQETLFFTSGDHSQVPIETSMISVIILQSILQQLGMPYIVRYVDKNFRYDPDTKRFYGPI